MHVVVNRLRPYITIHDPSAENLKKMVHVMNLPGLFDIRNKQRISSIALKASHTQISSLLRAIFEKVACVSL